MEKNNLYFEVVDELCEEFRPEPLVSNVQVEFETEFPEGSVVDSFNGVHVNSENKDLINLSSYGFLGLSTHPEVTEAAKAGVRKYGVGACGPRGFYGTFDSHLETEEELARFFGVEEAIVFSSGYATVSSTIPAFAKRGDFLICDKGISHSLQTGVLLSRSNAYWFKHNDPEDLERILKEIDQSQREKGVNMDKPKERKFLVIEGLYQNYGDIAPVAKYLELKEKYNFRIVLDDSVGFGGLGKSGKGTLEFLGIDYEAVDIITSSLANAVGTVGGFCIGKKEVVYHQRLNAAGYCFSASSPPYLLIAGTKALSLINEQAMDVLRSRVARIRSAITKQPFLSVHGNAESPVIHLRLVSSTLPRKEQNWLLQKISDHAKDRGVAISRCRYVDGEKYQPPPSLRICVSSLLSDSQIDQVCSTIIQSAKTVLNE